MLFKRSRRQAAGEVRPSVSDPRISVSDFRDDKLRLVDGRPRFGMFATLLSAELYKNGDRAASQAGPLVLAAYLLEGCLAELHSTRHG